MAKFQCGTQTSRKCMQNTGTTGHELVTAHSNFEGTSRHSSESPALGVCISTHLQNSKGPEHAIDLRQCPPEVVPGKVERFLQGRRNMNLVQTPCGSHAGQKTQ